ncbi:hypothetical protein TCAL_11547 [Tigriopus californicus]|uniref:Uncharacterized protein n=1 Tax=Tigriopus californicus TaxID=6832 RepID=A0A553NXX9_TIGCA|nr:hypothetical protein TCAL_11547 [Tigriopus californicus]|eukprot:TCALIF_11547-PA protein Name:"Protein of unknown function" AED:0.23 eAED:0.23 QI:350/0.66/0.5/1/1/0.75/4/0/1280
MEEAMAGSTGSASSSVSPPAPQWWATHLYDCLYGDLDEATQNLDLEELARQVQAGQAQVGALQARLAEAQDQQRDQAEIHRRTIQHLEGQAQLAVQSHASLLLTARAELNRKNDRIRELTDTLDRFMLKKCDKVGLLDQMRALLHEYYAQLIPERDCITLAVPDSVSCVSHNPRQTRPARPHPAEPEAPYQTEVKLQRSGQYNVLSMGSHSIAWHIQGCRPAKPPKTLRLKSRPPTAPLKPTLAPAPAPALFLTPVVSFEPTNPKSLVRETVSLEADSVAHRSSSRDTQPHRPPCPTDRPRSCPAVPRHAVPTEPRSSASVMPLDGPHAPLGHVVPPAGSHTQPACGSHPLANPSQPTSREEEKFDSANGKEAWPIPMMPEKNSTVPSHPISSQPGPSKKARLASLPSITPKSAPMSSEKLAPSKDRVSRSQDSDSIDQEFKTEKLTSTRLSSSQRSSPGSASSSSRANSKKGLERSQKDVGPDINMCKVTRPPVHVKSEALPVEPESRPKTRDQPQAPLETSAKKDEKVPFPEDLEDGEITSSEEETQKNPKHGGKVARPRSQTAVGARSRERTLKPPITTSSSPSSSFAQSLLPSSSARSERYKETLDKSSLSRKRAHSPRSHSSSSCSSSKRSSRRSGRSPKRLRHDHHSSSRRTSRESSSSRTKHKSSSSERSSEGLEHRGEHKDHKTTKSSKTIERPRKSVVVTSSKAQASVPNGAGGEQERGRAVEEGSQGEQPQQHIRSSTTMTMAKTTNRITSQVGAESWSKTLTKVVDREIRPENKSVSSSPKGGKAPRQLDEKLVSQKPSIQNTSVLPPESLSSVPARSTGSNVVTPKATNTQDPSKMKIINKEKKELELQSKEGNEPGNNEAPTETGLKIKLPLSTTRSSTSTSIFTSTKSSLNEVKKTSTEKSQLSQYLFGESETESQGISPRKEHFEGTKGTLGDGKSNKPQGVQDQDGMDMTDMNTVDIDSLIEEKTSQFQSLAKKADHIYQRILTSDAEDHHERKDSSPKDKHDSREELLAQASFDVSTEHPCSSPPSENDACYNPVSSPSRLRDSVPLPTYGSNRKRRITQEKIDFTSPVGIASLLKEVTEGAHLGTGNVIMTPKSGRSRSSSMSSNTGVPPSGTTPRSSRSSPAHARSSVVDRSTPFQGCVLFPESRDSPADPCRQLSILDPPPPLEGNSMEKKERTGSNHGSDPTEDASEGTSGNARERRLRKKKAKQEKAEKKKLKKAAKKEQKRLRKIEKKVNKRLKKEKSRNTFVIKSKADQICIYSHD